jgi:hypothetical protein
VLRVVAGSCLVWNAGCCSVGWRSLLLLLQLHQVVRVAGRIPPRRHSRKHTPHARPIPIKVRPAWRYVRPLLPQLLLLLLLPLLLCSARVEVRTQQVIRGREVALQLSRGSQEAAAVDVRHRKVGDSSFHGAHRNDLR